MTSHRPERVAAWVAAALCALASNARAQEPTASGAPLTAVRHEPAPAPALEPVVSVAGRVVAEALMGAGLATASFVAGPEIAGAACRKCLFAAGFAGGNAMFPVGVYWGGYLVRGEGSFWLAAAAPWLVSATAFTALVFDQDYDGQPAFQIGVIGGAIAAPLSILSYELSHASARAETVKEVAARRLHVAIGRHHDGMALIVGRRF